MTEAVKLGTSSDLTGHGGTRLSLLTLFSDVSFSPPSQLDNHGRRLLLSEEASLNIPAVAAAHVVKRYTAQAPDELSFEVRLWASRLQLGSPLPLPLLISLLPPAHSQVGDIVSVIDMPPTEDRSWWRGKRGFQVSLAYFGHVGLGCHAK